MADGGIRIGCTGLPPRLGQQKYFDSLTYLESDVLVKSPPRRAILERWRREVADDRSFGLLAPPIIGARGFAPTPDAVEAVNLLADAREALAAETIVFETPAGFTPSSAHRDAMTRFFAETTAGRFGDAALVWDPDGLWEPAAAVRFAAGLGLLWACDPLSNDPLGPGPALFANLPSKDAYFRVRRLGIGPRGFDAYALEDMLELAAGYERTWIAFGGNNKLGDAKQLAKLASASADDGASEDDD